jgi:hypothetical protein
MIMRKLVCLISFVLVVVLVSNAFGAFAYTWTNAAGTGMWCDGGNWDMGTPPTVDSGDVFFDAATRGSLITIPAGCDASCTFGNQYGTIFGPEFSTDLNIYGRLTYPWYMAAVNPNIDDRTVVKMYNGSYIKGEGVAIGDTWWWSGGPYVTMNMYGGNADLNWIWIGGHLNIYGGTMSILGGVAMSGNIADDLIRIDVRGGTLILPADFTGTVNDWISRGILLAYGAKPGTNGTSLIINTTVNPGRTTVTAIPEPCTLTLLSLGGLALIRRKRN